MEKGLRQCMGEQKLAQFQADGQVHLAVKVARATLRIVRRVEGVMPLQN